MVNTGFYIDAQDRIWWTDDPLLVTHVPYVDEGVTDRVRLVPVGEFPTLVDTVSIERRIGTDTNAEWVRIADHIDPQLTLTDPIPLLGHNTYRAISHSADGAASIGPEFEIEWPWRDSGLGYVNTGTGWALQARAWSTDVGRAPEIDAVVERWSGVTGYGDPIYGAGELETVTVSGELQATLGCSTAEEWLDVLRAREPVCYRDTQGRRIFGMLSISALDQSRTQHPIQYAIRRTDTTELDH